MSYKALTFLITILFFHSPIIPATQQDSLLHALEDLKKLVPILKSRIYPDGMPQATDSDIQGVETYIKDALPSTLRRFCLEVGHLHFKGIEPARAHGGNNSSLCNLIKEGRRAKIPNEWIPFCKDNSSYFCIHRSSAIVKLFACPRYEPSDAYDNLAVWITKELMPLQPQ